MNHVHGGPFRSSPYLIVVHQGGAGEPDKLRLCINLPKSNGGQSAGNLSAVNDFISLKLPETQHVQYVYTKLNYSES
jgi:hypothetical protein